MNNDRELRPQHVGATNNKVNLLQQDSIKYYSCNTAARKMYDIKFMTEFVSVRKAVICRRWEINSYACLFISYAGTEE